MDIILQQFYTFVDPHVKSPVIDFIQVLVVFAKTAVTSSHSTDNRSIIAWITRCLGIIGYMDLSCIALPQKRKYQGIYNYDMCMYMYMYVNSLSLYEYKFQNDTLTFLLITNSYIYIYIYKVIYGETRYIEKKVSL